MYFNALVDTSLDEISNVDACKVKTLVTEHLQSLLPDTQAYYLKQLEYRHSLEDLLHFLIKSGFCSYLDYKPLSTIISHCGSDKLKQQLESYGREYKAFFKETTLTEVVHTLTNNRGLQPVTSARSPFLVFQLSHPWPDLRLHTATATLGRVLPWVSQLQLQSVEGGEHIALVFCSNKSALTALVRDLQKPETVSMLNELDMLVVLQVVTHEAQVMNCFHHHVLDIALILSLSMLYCSLPLS